MSVINVPREEVVASEGKNNFLSATLAATREKLVQESTLTPPLAEEANKNLSAHLVGGIIYALVFWWLSTAAIIYFNFQPETRVGIFWFTLALACGAVYFLIKHRNDGTVKGAYITFTAASIIWAFVEVSFYTGFIVGPQVRPLFTIGPSWQAFHQAVHRSVYHEVMVLSCATGLSVLWFFSKNKFGVQTFFIFWLMHQSAKLNIFLGVTNTGREFLPDTVSSLKPYMTVAAMNWLFPISVTVATIAAYQLISKIWREEETWRKVGHALVGMMALFAVLEHWMLILPLDGSLWDIAVPHLRHP
jgi:putative photosynthetic complex assembly protein 2